MTSTRPTVAAFVAPAPLATGSLALDEDAAHHARVRRLSEGDAVTLRDGAGGVADGVIARIARAALHVDVAAVRHVVPPPPVHLLAPIGDRDRMLWLAEKCTELGLASWRGVRWRRSLSVSLRGEGDAFAGKLRARMAQALAQCEGAWLPAIHPDADPSAALGDAAPGLRLVLDAEGEPLDTFYSVTSLGTAVTLALGPEGGLEAEELAAAEAAGFRRARLPGNILRFETAGAVGVAFARALLDRPHPGADPR